MDNRTARQIDQYLTADPYEFGPTDIGTDRPIVDAAAQDAAERNAAATAAAARKANS